MHKCHANASNSSDLQLSHLLDPHIHGLCTAPARTTRQTHRSRRTAGMQARIARSPSPAHPILSYPAGTGPSTVPWFPNPSPPAPAAQGRVNASCSLVNGHGVTPALDPLLSPSIPSSSNTGAVAFALCDCAETLAASQRAGLQSQSQACPLKAEDAFGRGKHGTSSGAASSRVAVLESFCVL